MQMAATMDQILETLQEFREETYQKFDQIDRRFDDVYQRFEQIDRRFDDVDQKFDQIQRTMQFTEQRYLEDRAMMMQLIHEVKDQQKEDRTMTMQLIHEVKDQQKEDHKMIMEDHKMILDIWASRDKITMNFNRKLYVATASISVVVSAIVSTGISFAIQGL